MNRLPSLTLVILAVVSVASSEPPARSQERDPAGPSATAEHDAALAKAADYMARRALEGHSAFDTGEIKAETGVDVELIEEQVLQQAMLDRLAELRDELPGPDDTGLTEQGNLVSLDSFEQFVEAFDAYQDVPRIVLLLSPT